MNWAGPSFGPISSDRLTPGQSLRLCCLVAELPSGGLWHGDHLVGCMIPEQRLLCWLLGWLHPTCTIKQDLKVPLYQYPRKLEPKTADYLLGSSPQGLPYLLSSWYCQEPTPLPTSPCRITYQDTGESICLQDPGFSTN